MREVCDPRPNQLRLARDVDLLHLGARPKVGRSEVARMRSRVVLPAPFGPSSAIVLADSTRSETPASAALRPNRRASWWVATAGGGVCSRVRGAA